MAERRLRPIFVWAVGEDCGDGDLVFCRELHIFVTQRKEQEKETGMKTTQEYIQLLKEYKQTRGIIYGISRIGIFGSVARGEQTEDSDVDVCVDLAVPNIFSLVHIKEELRQLFGCEVDVVRIRQNMDALLKRDIMEEGIYV